MERGEERKTALPLILDPPPTLNSRNRVRFKWQLPRPGCPTSCTQLIGNNQRS